MLKLAFASVFAGFLCCASFAGADEVWRSRTAGDVVYEADIGDTAVLSYGGSGRGGRAMLYLPGAAGTTERYTYWGYWIDPARGDECGMEMTGPDGTRARSWGQAIVMFDHAGFPSGFSALLGNCFDQPFEAMRAEAQ